MEKKNLWSNLNDIQKKDEIKFVIGDKNDFDWSVKQINDKKINEKCTILFSPVFGKIKPEKITNWIIESNIPVRFQLQSHKYIWSPESKGV